VTSVTGKSRRREHTSIINYRSGGLLRVSSPGSAVYFSLIENRLRVYARSARLAWSPGLKTVAVATPAAILRLALGRVNGLQQWTATDTERTL
jgi:hypothetical protein